jgi:hypothetical protein
MSKPLDARLDELVERYTRQQALRECFNQLTGEQRADLRRELADAFLEGAFLAATIGLAGGVQEAIRTTATRRGITVGKVTEDLAGS